jgi:hypothetical protein
VTWARPLADPLAGRAVARDVRRIAWGAASAAWVLGVLGVATSPGFYPGWYLVFAFALLAVPLVLALRSWRRQDGPVRALQAFVLIVIALRLADPWFVTQPSGSTDYPPLAGVLMAGMILTGLVFGPRVGVPLVAVYCLALTAGRVGVVGLPQSVAELAVDAAGTLAPFVLISTIRGELDRLPGATRWRRPSTPTRSCW